MNAKRGELITDMLQQLFGIDLKNISPPFAATSLIINSVEISAGQFRVSAQVIHNGVELRRFCFCATRENLGARISKLLSYLPYEYTLQQSKFSYGRSYFRYDLTD